MGARPGLILLLLWLCASTVIAGDLPLHQLILPAGFKIELYTDKVPNARSLHLTPSGTLFVGSRHAGKVYAVRDNNGDGWAERVHVIASDLNSPNGVAFHQGSLYVAEIDRILRYDKIEWKLTNPPEPVVLSRDFPSDELHGWKFLRIGPDNKLYVPIGAPCNVCLEYGYAAITRLNLDGSQHEVYAEGIRNTVGFDWHPDSKELWFTDNGRDELGDDTPPDELNRAPKRGLHFGFPYCHGGKVLDPEYGLGHSCKEYEAPVQKLGAHVAALGMRFYTGKMFPALYNKQIFIAEHGSWNRSKKTGYQISLVRLKGNKAISYTPFVQGWLQGESAWGRPVDVEMMADGSLLVSDDKAGAIYRITYQGKAGRHQPSSFSQPDTTGVNAGLPVLPATAPASSPDPLLGQPGQAQAKPSPAEDVPPPDVMEKQESRQMEKDDSSDPFSAVKKHKIINAP